MIESDEKGCEGGGMKSAVETCQDMRAALEEYSLEMDLINRLTLKDLIASHKRLREAASRDADAIRVEVEKARVNGHEEGKRYALEHDYISRERLKQVTLRELSELLADDATGG